MTFFDLQLQSKCLKNCPGLRSTASDIFYFDISVDILVNTSNEFLTSLFNICKTSQIFYKARL